MYYVQRQIHNAGTWINISSFGSEAQAKLHADQIKIQNKSKYKDINTRVKHKGSVIYVA